MEKEIERIVNKYPRDDSKELFRSELVYLVEQTINKIWEWEWREESIDHYKNKLLNF